MRLSHRAAVGPLLHKPMERTIGISSMRLDGRCSTTAGDIFVRYRVDDVHCTVEWVRKFMALTELVQNQVRSPCANPGRVDVSRRRQC